MCPQTFEAAGYSPIAGVDEDGDGDSNSAPLCGVSKYNHNHDELGRFTFGAGGAAADGGSSTSAPSSDQGTSGSSNSGVGGAAQNGDRGNLMPAAYHPAQFDMVGAVDALNQAVDKLKADQIANGQPNLFGADKCAHYVADAIEKGGGLAATPRPQDAKDFGPWLENNNFSPIATWGGEPSSFVANNGYVSGYTPQAGDIAVIQPYDGGNSSGHMDMYNELLPVV